MGSSFAARDAGYKPKIIPTAPEVLKASITESGVTIVFIGRFVPVIRHFISIPAGIGRMPLLPFSIVTLIGATIWNTFLLGLGMKLRDHWQIVQKYSHQIDIVIVAFCGIGAIWWFWSRRKHISPGSNQ